MQLNLILPCRVTCFGDIYYCLLTQATKATAILRENTRKGFSFLLWITFQWVKLEIYIVHSCLNICNLDEDKEAFCNA